MADPHFWTMLQSRPSSNDNSICDVYDGAEYKQYSSYGGFLCKLTNPANVSFIMNTDGIAIFRSVSTDVWPVYLAVNELPIHAR